MKPANYENVRPTDKLLLKCNRQYLSLSGGDYYWSSFFSSAKVFSSEDSIRMLMKTAEFTENVQMTSGKTYPPTLIAEALAISDKNQEAHGEMEIIRILEEVISTHPISGRITRETRPRGLSEEEWAAVLAVRKRK